MVVVVFVGDPCCTLTCHIVRHVLIWLVTWPSTLLLWWLVVVVSGWRWWSVVAVGDGHCMCTGCGLWLLWLFVFVGIVVCGCHHLQCGLSLLVVMCLDGGGKQKRNHIMLPNKHCLLSITNK